MDTFFATLAQTTAAFLGILAASVAAFYIFLQDKTTQYDLRREETQMQIRSTLMDLRRSWPATFGHELTYEFAGIYRAKHPGKSQVELVRQAAFDFGFNDPDLYGAISKLNNKYNIPERPWRGRLAFWILTEFVSIVTGGPLDTRTKPEGVFPMAPLGPGFDEWRREFQRLTDVVSIFQFHREEVVADFNAYANEVHAVFWPQYSGPALEQLLSALQRIYAGLEEIDKISILKTQYSFSRRVHIVLLGVLGSLSFLIGIVIPMLFLAGAWGTRSTPIFATTILVGTLTFTLGAGFILARDLATRPTTTPYTRVRWLEPMLVELKEVHQQLSLGGLVDVDFFSEVLLREDRASLSESIHGVLQRFCTSARRYNAAASRLSERASGTISSDEVLGKIFVRPWTTGGTGTILTPADMIDRTKIAEAVKALRANASTNLMIEMRLNRGSQSLGGFSPAALRASPAPLARLEDISVVLSATDEARSFEVERDQLRAEALILQTAIEKS